MSSLIRVRPIKTELIKLRRRIRLAYKVKDVLSERLTVLTNELLARINEAKILRKKLYDSLLSCGYKYAVVKSLHAQGINSVVEAGGVSLETDIYTENIMGVKVPITKLFIKDSSFLAKLGLSDYADELSRLLEYLSELSRAESSIRALHNEIKKTKRKVNALDYIIIPQLKSTIKAISMKFDEKEREEKTRLKRVKTILERRRK
jgi:V/A-type H+-transporting ATPase subunit D